MGEIIHFEPRDRTAMGRFFIAVDRQGEEASRKVARKNATNRPDQAKIIAAQKELDFLFYGPNSEETNKIYQQGLYDIVHQKRTVLTIDEKIKELEMVLKRVNANFTIITEMYEEQYDTTPAGAFYIHVEQLLNIAHYAQDHLSEE